MKGIEEIEETVQTEREKIGESDGDGGERERERGQRERYERGGERYERERGEAEGIANTIRL